MTRPVTFLVRYDEIGLKGKNRKYFISALLDNIKNKLSGLEGIRFRVPHGRIVVCANPENVDEISRNLRLVPGIASFSMGVTMEPEFDSIAELGIQWIEPLLKPGGSLRFCVRTNRSNKSFFKNSQECNREIGSRILGRLHDKGLVVNINEADFILEIEIGQDETIVFKERVPGIRGLPVGTAGNVMCLLSGGIDSPVAMFKMIRRGCNAHGVFFDNRTYLGRGGYDKVLKLSKVLSQFQNKAKLFAVPFEDIQVAIRDNCHEPHRIVLYRRMMYRIAEILAEQNRCLGIVTGESLGQVASQTLENLSAVSNVVNSSVFRPLIGMDKVEIIDQARKIGTYDISIEPQPDCCSVFTPDSPAIRARIPHLEEDEKKFPWQDLIDAVLKKVEVVEFCGSG